MQAARQLDYLSVDAFLAGERGSEIRHEYVDGVAYVMAGASINHNQITANLLTSLMLHLRNQECRPFSSDLMVKTGKERYRYPDIPSAIENSVFIF